MKTQLTTIFKKSANTPPMWVCLLFALVISTNSWGESVTVTFGQGNTSGSGSTLPNEGTRTISGVTATTNLKLKSTVKYQSTETTYNYSFSNDNTDYVDISVAEGYYITGVGTSVLYDGDGDGSLYIQFYSTSDKNNAVGTPIALNGDSYNNFYTYPPSTSSVSLPEGTKKSARIYKSGTRAWGILFYRLVVNIECVSKTASFTGTGSTSGSAPSNINACVGTNILIPNAGTLVKTGYDFVGWNDGTTTYSVNEEYQLDDNTSFSPVWTEHVIPAVTNLNTSVDDDDVTITWTNYNKVDLTSDNAKEEGWNQHGTINSRSVANGVLTVSYTTDAEWAWKSIEIPLSREMNHVTSIDMQYTYNNAQAKDGNNEGGIAPYMMYNGDGGWTCFWKRSDPTSLGFWASNVTEYTNYNLTPDQILGSTGSGSYDNQRLIHKVGLLIDPAVASSGTFTVKDICINTSDNQTTLDEIKIIRKKGSAPSSISDGTQVYSGVLNTFTDEDLEDGSYYYAVYAREGSLYSAAVVEGPIQIGTPKADPELTASVDKGAISTTGSAQLTVNKANAYDGTIEYSVSPSGVISLNETTGEITAVAAGTATITVNAPATSGYYSDNKSVTVAVIAAPETNLAITNVDGDNVTLTWDVPGKIDLSTWSLSSDYLYSPQNPTSSDKVSYDPATEELTVSYVGSYGSQNGVAFPFELGNVETVSYDYIGYNVFPMVVKNGSRYFGGVPQGDYVEWHSESVSPNTKYWSQGDKTISDPSKAISICANPEAEPYSRTFRLRNVFYHCTGMTDIDRIVIRRTTSAPATSITDGDEIFSGKMSHFVDTDSKAAGLYYYTLFAVYANGCIPVEYVTLDNRSFSITYKDKGDAEFSGTHETGYPTTHSNAAATALQKATKEDYIFVGWYDNAACTGDAVTSLAAGAYDADITLYARWEQLSLHQPGKYQAPDGYGRVLKNVNGHDYEVYLVTYDEAGRECESGCDNKNGELYAGPVDAIHDGYRMFTGSANTEAKSADGWVAFKPYKYYGDAASSNYDEFQKLNANSSISSSRYARIGEGYYVRLYVQGYDQFAFVGQDNSADNHFVIRIDGIQQAYTPDNNTHVTRYDLTTNEPHFIEITGSTSNTNSKFRGFSLRLPDVERYTVTVAKNDNSYGTVSAASIANVRAGEATYITDNTVYIAGTTVTATPAENTAQYTYAFDNWSGVPANITEATTVTANFTRTANDYTLTWDLDGGTVTTAGTGAEMDATGTPSSSVAYGTPITAPIVAKDGYAFTGWDVTPSTMPAENITYTAQWALFHQSGKYVTEEGEGGYGQDLKFDNHRYYEVYRFAKVEDKGALYAGSKSTVTDGFAIISNAENNAESKDNDGWVVVKPYDYTLSGGTYNIGAEFMTIKSYTRFSSSHHLRLYIQGYDEFAFAARDNGTSEQLVVRINGVEQSYEQSTNDHISNRYSLDENTPYVIEITSNSTNHNCRILGFSLRIPGVEQYTVTMASSNNSYGTVDVANVSPVPSGSTISIADNVLTLNETNVTATPTTATAEYTYAFNGWSVSNGASITEDQTITANFTRTTNSYTLTWNLDGGTVTEAGTGVDVNATGTPSSSVVYGTAITVPTVTKAGSDFLGWDVTPAATMPAEDVTYTAKWYAPVVIPSGTTHLDANNYYPYTTAAKAPTKSTFNVDGEGAAETCLDISDNHYAEWQAKIAQGYYQVTMLYGTTGYAVNVNLKVIDPSTNPETVICTTTTDIHSDGSGNHCCYQAKWGVDLRGIDDDPDKLYIIRVEDVYDDTGSHPQIGYVEFEPATPTTLSGTAPTYLNHNNVTTAYRITPFDIDNNGNNEMCVFIGNQNQAEWLIKINPAIYNVRVRYGKESGGVKLNLYLINKDGAEVWTSDQRSLSSDTRYETWEINGLNLLDDYSSSKEYLLRIKDTYGSNGSTPNIEYIEFIPKVTYTRTGLTVGNYGTICLPYTVAAEDIHGADIFDMQGWPAGSVAVVLNEVDNMEAGRPYIFQATAATATFRYYAEGDEAAAGSHNGLIGSYTKEVIPANENNYMVYNNKLYLVDVLAYVGINKAYINRTLAEVAAEPVAPAPGKRQIRLFLDGEQVVTDIDQINDQMTNTKYMENGILYILREGKVYNAQGQLVK